MRHRTLGRTGLQVSEIGFGGIPIQRVPSEEVGAIVNSALDRGINFFDTARAYTDSESKLGAALRMRRGEAIVATKSMARTGEAMAADIRQSLETTGLDQIDLYQVHNVKDRASLERMLAGDGALAALKDARREGLIRHLGVTGHIKPVLLELLKTGEFETVQFPFNPVETDGVRELLEAAAQAGAGVIVMKPMAGGALKNAALSLKFILEYPVSVAIPGMDSVDQVAANAAVGEAPPGLTAEERETLAREAAALGPGFCRRCEYCLPCQQGIDIPMVFLLDGYYRRYDLKNWARLRYSEMKVRPDACQECGECEERCPYSLPIRRMLQEAVGRLAPGQAG
jgi:predicted aldo/keto reductase-like oxidoreductase